MKRLLPVCALLLAAPALAQTSDRPPMPMAGAAAHNAWLGRSFVERLLASPSAEHRQQVIDQIISPDYIQHNPLVPPGAKGLAGWESTLWASFPDEKVELQDVVATKDRVVARYVLSGTLTGAAMMGAPAKGQKIRVGVIDIWSVKDGKLYEHWDQIDWTSLLAQLGVPGLPAPFYTIAGVTTPGQ